MRYAFSSEKELAQIAQPGFWHLTLCTLLSSQGSGAPALHLAVSFQGNCSNLPLEGLKSRRHAVTFASEDTKNSDSIWWVLVPLEAGKHCGFSAPLG
jgi:hypothetical protein